VNLEDDWMTMNCMNCSNADSKMIASNVDSSQENRDVRLKHLCNDEKNVANIINYYERIKTEQDWSFNQFAVNASEFSA